MQDPLGPLLREWRTRRQLSIDQLAARALVAKSTISEWEGGAHQPCLPELEAVLAALGASPEQRQRALSLLRAPRAIRALRRETAPGTAGGAYPSAMPAGGDLLRAMRCRRGLTLEQVGAALRVQPSTVSRWERSETVPSAAWRAALFGLLGARPEEQAALAEDHWLLVPPAEEEGTSLDEIEVGFLALRDQVRAGDRALMDLQFLALEAQLWAAAQCRPSARELLILAWSEYAAWLSWDDRKPEAGRYAERVLEWARNDAALIRRIPCTVLGALHVAALVVGYRPGPRAPHRAVELLQAWLPASAAPEWTADLYRNMATHAARGEAFAAALQFSHQALEVMEQHRLDAFIPLWQHAHADILWQAGRAREAHPLLAPGRDIDPFRRLLEALLCTKVLLALGERIEASIRLTQAYDLIDAHQYPNFRLTADALAATL